MSTNGIAYLAGTRRPTNIIAATKIGSKAKKASNAELIGHSIDQGVWNWGLIPKSNLIKIARLTLTLVGNNIALSD
jgi:hypothetical protein